MITHGPDTLEKIGLIDLDHYIGRDDDRPSFVPNYILQLDTAFPAALRQIKKGV